MEGQHLLSIHQALLQNSFNLHEMASKQPPEVITIPNDNNDDEEEDWPETGPVNRNEAQKYKHQVNEIYLHSCIYLCQHVSKGGVDIVIPEEEPPAGRDFIWKLPEKRCRQEEIKLIIGIFNHVCEAHSQLAAAAANFSSLAKVMD